MKLTKIAAALALMPMALGFGADGKAQSGQTACFSRAGLAEGTAANTIQILAPNGAGIDFAIDGIGYHKADTDNIAMTALAAQADLTTCLYLVQIDSAGTVSMKKGEEVLTADLTNGKTVVHWPEPDANKCPIGGLRIVNTSGAVFTSGTTDLGAAGITDTFFNFLGGMPLAPLTS